MLCENAKLPIPPMAHLRLIAAVACATAAAAAPTSSRGLPASARRAGRRPAGERALAAHLGRPRLQRRRVGDGHDAGLELRVEDGAQGLERPLLRNGSTSWWSDVLVALQGALTVIGNITMCIAAFRIFKASQESSKMVMVSQVHESWTGQPEGSSIGMKPPLCLDMDRMSGLRERDVSRIGTLLDSIGRCSSLAPRQDNQQQQQRKQPAHAPMALRRKRLRLRRRRETMRRSDGMEMEMVNLKLYLENRCILEENERLREKASALHRENLALRADLRNTSSPATTAAAASSC
uniref:BZIP domain-containing protein n=1 Tax=Oryza rufipogon TaxID=4529 RepID=A0A0E0QTY6_ORYRU